MHPTASTQKRSTGFVFVIAAVVFVSVGSSMAATRSPFGQSYDPEVSRRNGGEPAYDFIDRISIVMARVSRLGALGASAMDRFGVDDDVCVECENLPVPRRTERRSERDRLSERAPSWMLPRS